MFSRTRNSRADAWLLRCPGAVLLGTLLAGTLQAATITFDAGGDGTNWSDANNWNPDMTPGAADTAEIGNFATQVNDPASSNSTFEVGSLQINHGGGSATVGTGNRLNLAGDGRIDGRLVLADSNVSNSSGGFSFVGTRTAPITLNGTGSIDFATGNLNILGTQGGGALTIGPDLTLRTVGSGSKADVTVALRNQGTVLADSTSSANKGIVRLAGPAKTNAGLMHATAGGRLFVDNVTVTQEAGATIQADGGGELSFSNGTVLGGRVTGSGSVEIDNQRSATFNDVAIGGLTLNVDENERAIFAGNVTNGGTVVLADADPNNTFGGFSTLRLDGATLSGAGEVLFTTANLNRIDSIGQSTFGPGQVARTVGAGSVGTINAELVNQGLITTSGGRIDFAGSTKRNENAISATDGGIIRLNPGARVEQSAAGHIDIHPTSELQLQQGSRIVGGSISGGTLDPQGLVYLDGSALPLRLDGVQIVVDHNEEVRLVGTVVNDSRIELNDTDPDLSFGNFSRLSNEAPVRIDGHGEIVFATANDNQLIGTGSFELGSGQTLRADAGTRGSIFTTVTNHATVLVNGAINGGMNLHNASGGRVTGNGELTVGGTFANDALLTAGPRLHGDLGLLTLINADVDNSASSETLFEIGGDGGVSNRGTTYDALSVDRTFDLAGSLLVDLLGGFRPTFDSEYFVVEGSADSSARSTTSRTSPAASAPSASARPTSRCATTFWY